MSPTISAGHVAPVRSSSATVKRSANYSTHIKTTLLTIACFAILQQARGVSPDPDGAYTNANTAEGSGALFSLTNGVWNTALGFQTLFADTSGTWNTAVGTRALFHNGAAIANTATGVFALFNNVAGNYNTASGFEALTNNSSGTRNTAAGAFALFHHTSGNYENAFGAYALFNDTTGSTNNAFGESALELNTTGRDNTAMGDDALHDNTTGGANIALGTQAGRFLTTGNFNIDIGNTGVPGESSTIRIGGPFQTRVFIAGIRGVPTGIANAVPILIDSAGQLGTASSSRRFKKDIRPMDKSREAILALQPVRFEYKSDHSETPQFGLIAEDVAKVDPNLVVRDEQGEIYTVRYDAVNAMLLNEFLKEHQKVEQQERRLQQQEATITKQQKQIEALTRGLQKVNDHLQLSKPASQTVLNNR